MALGIHELTVEWGIQMIKQTRAAEHMLTVYVSTRKYIVLHSTCQKHLTGLTVVRNIFQRKIRGLV